MNKSDFLQTWQGNSEYFKLLELMARLSNIFSDNTIPFLHYRVTENLFCKYYAAENLSRSDTAYDAKKNNFGIGIKTFQLKNDNSMEKVAEFNSISNQLKQYQGKDLAYQLSIARNERIRLGQRLYAIDEGCYHIVGRVEEGLTIFNTPYPFINERTISNVKNTEKSLQFFDGENEYSYNHSKSTLFKRFYVPKENVKIPVSIIQDPYELLRKLINTDDYEGKANDITSIHKVIHSKIQQQLVHGINYVILPLYSPKCNIVQEKSGLNQWNAAGRPRDPNEIYIPVPKQIHRMFPSFFPDRDINFTLHLPNGKDISAKICQAEGKALMSKPNKLLGEWLLRDVLQLKEGELLTMQILNRMGFDSVIVYKNSLHDFKIDVCRTMKYSDQLFD